MLALALGACAARPPPRPAPAASAPPSASPAELQAAIATDAERSDRATDAHAREALAADAERDAQACLAQAPQAAPCLYGQAVALGLEARAHPTRAGQLLGEMLTTLSRAEAADPDYDQAGPARVRALVLARAPGWPLGPGDPQAAVEAGRRAVARRPDYPPNRLALAEALSKAGDAAEARDNFERAREAARAAPAGPERDQWLRDAEQGLAQR
ncbi:MAG TPA: tetratricopeptide repeat protein [Steroidobacteraceae bacterium]|nr:tetratricopeptide repeat protein [Steroidobacteraceae bacterium]